MIKKSEPKYYTCLCGLKNIFHPLSMKCNCGRQYHMYHDTEGKQFAQLVYNPDPDKERKEFGKLIPVELITKENNEANAI